MAASFELVIAFLGAAVLSLAITPAVRVRAVGWGVIDIPDHRKLHTVPVPRCGGIAVALAILVAGAGVWAASVLTTAGPRPAPALLYVLAGTGLALFVTGLVDDVRSLSAPVKLAVECLAAVAVSWVVMRGTPVRFTPFSVPLDLGLLGVALGALWIVALTNAVNMLDVADGVAGGISAVAALAIGVIGLSLGNPLPATIAVLLSGALVGFLPHNFREPRVFLGDSGSLVAGFLLGACSLAGTRSGGAFLALPAILALGLPLAEVGVSVARRTMQAFTVVRPGSGRERFLLRLGRPGLFVPDRRHIPHRLLDLGLAPSIAIGALYSVGLSLAVLAVITAWWPRLGLFAGLVALAAALYGAPRWLYEELRVLDRGTFLPLLETRLIRNRTFHVLLDAAVVTSAFSIALALEPGRIISLGQLLVLVPVTLAGFKISGLYRGSYRNASFAEAARAIRAVLVGGILGMAAVVGMPGPAMLRASGWLAYLYLLLTAVVAMRMAFRVLEYVYQRGRTGERRALIVGTDRAAALALRELLATPELGLVPVGFLDGAAAELGSEYHGYPVYAGDERLAETVRARGATDLIVPETEAGVDKLGEIRRVQSELGVRVLRFSVRWLADETV